MLCEKKNNCFFSHVCLTDDYEMFYIQFKYNVSVCGIPISIFVLVNHINQHIHLPKSTLVSLTQVNCPLIFSDASFAQRNRYQRPICLICFLYMYEKNS